MLELSFEKRRRGPVNVALALGLGLLTALHSRASAQPAADAASRDGWTWASATATSVSTRSVRLTSARGARPRHTRASIEALAELCAPTTPARTLASIAEVESRFDPLAIHDNTSGASFHLSTPAAAARVAADLLHRGHSVDLGLGQINAATLLRLGLGVADAFDACRSLWAAGQVIDANYVKALRSAAGAPLLQTAYSIYNTGDRRRGFRNGYADRIVAATQRTIR